MSQRASQPSQPSPGSSADGPRADAEAGASPRGSAAERARQQAAVAELGLAALRHLPLDTLLSETARAVVDTLGDEFCKILELLPGGREMRLVAGVGWRAGLVGRAVVSAGRESQGGYTLIAGGPVIVDDLRAETRFTAMTLLAEHGVVSGMSVVIYADGRPWGVLGTHSREPRRFTPDDVHFLQAVANVLGAAIERDHAERVLQASEARFRDTVEQAAVGIAHVSLDGSWLLVNQRLADIVGYARDELLARTFQDITHPEDLDADLAYLERALAGAGDSYRMEKRYLRKDGSVVWVALHVALVRDGTGAPGYFVTIVQDIDSRKQAEAALSAAAERAARLQRLTTLLAMAVTARDVADVVTGELRKAAGAVATFVAVCANESPAGFDPRGVQHSTELAIIGAAGHPQPLVEQWRRFPVEAAIPAADVVRTGQPLWLTDREQFVAAYPHRGGEAITDAAAVLPLRASARAGHAPFGAIALSFCGPHLFTDEERAFLEAIAHQTSLALERVWLYESERAARVAAEGANAAKSAFLATMSHEIRTPLNATIGYTELLELGLAGPLTTGQRQYLDRVRTSSMHLLGLINDVLDLSKIEAQQLTVLQRPASIARVAETAVALVHPQAAARALALVNACGRGNDCAFVGDEDRAKQILVNLLSNAVRFTEPGGRITLSCGSVREPPPGAALVGDGPWVYVRVEDTGIGIAAEKHDAVFDAFVQVESGHTRTKGGTGLGLTISRRLARLMGGDLTVHSAQGVGSAFFLWLPAAAPADAALVATAAPERRGAARDTRGLSEVAEVALQELERVVTAYAARLRTDSATPDARLLSVAELEDHTATLLADIAETLDHIEDAEGGASDLLRDASLIQRLVAERHGRARARAKWTADEVRREYEILREELARAVRRRVGDRSASGAAPPEPEAVDRALALFGHFIEAAERTSLGALREGA